jgi:hypothetical protein
MTVHATETGEEGSADEEDNHVHGVLSLTGEPSTERRVQWDDDVIDNEHLNKKKSKSKHHFLLLPQPSHRQPNNMHTTHTTTTKRSVNCSIICRNSELTHTPPPLK